MGYYWQPYVPAATRRRAALKEIGKMRGKGLDIQPVRIEGRAIARTFWGKAWCRHLESFSDYENRLPRGRTYVRNGSVCHLEILPGELRAKVQGSRMYTVTVKIKPLAGDAWTRIKNRCTGHISSLLDLLQGRLSDGIMAIVTDREDGLFPKPREIDLDCSCPDWADMCKHVAAVLYGVGSRLDEKPELLFLLRGVDHQELISAKAEAAVESVVKGGKRRRLVSGDLGEVFGVEIEAQVVQGRSGEKPAARVTPAFPKALKARHISALRERLGLSRQEFARLLKVSVPAIGQWENSTRTLQLRARGLAGLEGAWGLDRASALDRLST